MPKSKQQPLLVHLTNIPTPYRIAFCNTLREALLAVGYDLHVLYCAERESDRYWEIPFQDIRYAYEVLSGISPRLGYWHAHFNPSVVQRLRQLRPQFLLVAGGWNMPSALLASNRTMSGSMWRVFWNEGHPTAVHHPSGPIAWLRRRCLHAYDAFAVPNEASARFVEMELGFRPIILPLPNTVDDEFYCVAREFNKTELRRALGLPLDATVFVSVARLDELKGIRELVKAVGQLKATERHCTLVLVGEGPLRKELEQYVQSIQVDVRLVGHQNAEGVRAYLASADAFVLASKYDPNPLSVIEAAFAGLPILVSHKAGNVKELVHDGISGIVISSIDSDTIGAVLARFCRLGDAERRQLGFGAAHLAESGFRQQDVARNFVSALLEQRRTA